MLRSRVSTVPPKRKEKENCEEDARESVRGRERDREDDEVKEDPPSTNDVLIRERSVVPETHVGVHIAY